MLKRPIVPVVRSYQGALWNFRLLGPLEVDDDGRSVAVGAGKRRALLALLLLHSNEVVSADRLIAELWGSNRPVMPHTLRA